MIHSRYFISLECIKDLFLEEAFEYSWILYYYYASWALLLFSETTEKRLVYYLHRMKKPYAYIY